MKAHSLRAIGLAIRLALARLGWGNAIACFLCLLGLAGWAWVIPHMKTQLQDREQAIASAERMLQRPSPVTTNDVLSADEERLETFYATLGEKNQVEQQIKVLFAIAGKADLALNQAEYKSAFIKHGHFHTYQILLPVNGTYRAIRQFCEATLLTLPFASIDELDFKREAIANRTVEAKVRLTLYLKDESSRNTAAQPQAAGNFMPASLSLNAKAMEPSATGDQGPALFHLQSRPSFISVQAADQANAASLFNSQTWTPPPPPPKPLPPPPPTAPPLPFTYLGKKIEDGVWEVYLARDEATYIVREQNVIEGIYRVDAIKPPTLSLTYLPLNQAQTLNIRGID